MPFIVRNNVTLRSREGGGMFKLGLFCTLLLCIVFSNAHGADKIPPKTFVVGVEEFYYAPHYFMEGHRYSGYGRDVLDLFAKTHGYHIVYETMPYMRIVSNLLNGKIDFQYPDNPIWLTDMKAGHKIYYSDGVVSYIDGVARKKTDLGKPLSDLKVMAMPIGWSPVNYYDLVQKKQLKIIELPSVEAVIQMLLTNRVDGIYLNADVVDFYLKKNSREGEAAFDPTLPYIYSQFNLSTTKYPQVIQEFNKFLKTNASAIEKIKRKYQFKYLSDPKN